MAGHSSDESISQTSSEDRVKSATKDTIEPYVADLEGDGIEVEKQKAAEKAEAVELIPTEAFQWNVDGDQSPCKFSSSMIYN